MMGRGRESVTVALDFDSKGRIWVVEMRSYMSNIDGLDEDASISRIVILEDENQDGIGCFNRVA